MEVAAPEICNYCNSPQVIGFKFCSSCGKRNIEDQKSQSFSEKRYRENLKWLAVYTAFSLILLVVSALTEDSFKVLVIWTACFAIIDFAFTIFQPSVWKLFQLNAIRILPLVSILLICLSSGFVVSFATDHLNLVLFGEKVGYIYLFQGLENPLLIALLFTAVFPAIFEELAFRGFVYNNLEVIGGEKAAMYGSTFLFALVHLSLLSLVWLIPFGLLLSYFRKKYNTIVYGIAGHFIHNSTVVMIEYYDLLS